MHPAFVALILAAIAQDKLEWKKDYDEGIKLAKESKKNAIVHLWTAT